MPKNIIQKLQRVQNAAARVVTLSSKFDHVTPILYELHWLPIAERIEYKILLLTFKALHNMAPQYIRDLIVLYRGDKDLRANDQLKLVVPRSHLVTYGDRAFSVAALHLWNTLPVGLRRSENMNSFKLKLKTYLFKKCYLY